MGRLDKEALETKCALQSAQLAYLSNIYDSLRSDSEISQTLENLPKALPIEMQSAIMAVYVGEPGDQLRLLAYAGIKENQIHKLNTFYDHDFILKEAIRSDKKAIYLSSTEDLLKKANIVSGLIVPLLSSTECIGVMFVGFREAKKIQIEIKEFIQSVGVQIGQAIAFRNLFRKVKFSEMRYRKLLENASCSIFVADLEGFILETNRQGEILLGSSREEILGKRFKDYFISPFRDHLAEWTSQLKSEKSLRQTEIQVQRKNGEIRTVEGSGVLVEIEDKPLVLMIGTDVTEINFLHAQMLVADKLSTMGLLGAGVAHEINNPIACVIANLNFMSEKKNDSEFKEIIKESLDAAYRVEEIVNELNVYTANNQKEEKVNICDVLDSALSMAFSEWKDITIVEKHYSKNVPELFVNRGKLLQVFLNLIINAASAMKSKAPDKNKIVISVSDVKDQVIVEIEDTGEGIPVQNIKKIFDPFFTTKPVGEGTGLGLFICYEVIKNMKGRINVKSKPGKGSKFIVSLPI